MKFTDGISSYGSAGIAPKPQVRPDPATEPPKRESTQTSSNALKISLRSYGNEQRGMRAYGEAIQSNAERARTASNFAIRQVAPLPEPPPQPAPPAAAASEPSVQPPAPPRQAAPTAVSAPTQSVGSFALDDDEAPPPSIQPSPRLLDLAARYVKAYVEGTDAGTQLSPEDRSARITDVAAFYHMRGAEGEERLERLVSALDAPE
jgi:hypothetical protein